MTPQPVPVTVPFLPPFDQFAALARGAWERNQLTNQGPLVVELEHRLAAHLGVAGPLHCVANGGLGLQLLLRAMDVRGKIVTTPFSYVATSSCPLWEGRRLAFADIDPRTLNLDPAAAAAAIDADCEAILATHAFGNPCDVEAFEALGRRHGLAVIYDAAHAFGVRYQGRGILDFGDASMVSTHATKLFHTVEGGFVVARDPAVMERVEWMRRFGHRGEHDFHGVGINAKMSELHAAVGLAVLPCLPRILDRRRALCDRYRAALADHPSVVPAMTPRPGTEWNHSYFPVLFADEDSLLATLGRMHAAGIRPRRYFHPTLDQAFASPASCPKAADISRRILCLPLFEQLDDATVDRILALLPPATRP